MLLAISAWVSEPAMRTARTTRSRLARCRDVCDPGVSIDSSTPDPDGRHDGRPLRGHDCGAPPFFQHVNPKQRLSRPLPSRPGPKRGRITPKRPPAGAGGRFVPYGTGERPCEGVLPRVLSYFTDPAVSPDTTCRSMNANRMITGTIATTEAAKR
ncbi:hypothetical protein GCM10018987_02350 [Streptomyces cremeus]